MSWSGGFAEWTEGDTAYLSIAFTWLLDKAYARALWYRALGYRVRAGGPHLCRAALRLWREFVFPRLGYQFAMSYQDADLHNGNTYRFDGWKRVAFAPGGGAPMRAPGAKGGTSGFGCGRRMPPGLPRRLRWPHNQALLNRESVD